MKKWCGMANKSNLKPMKGFIKTLQRHEELLMNWFRAEKKYSSGVVDGLNRRVNLVTRKSYGFKNYEILKLALFHTMGRLPEPEMTHRYYLKTLINLFFCFPSMNSRIYFQKM